MDYSVSKWQSTKVIELGSTAFRQFRAPNTNCYKIHGYFLTAKLWIGGSHLDDRGWIFGFGDLKDVRKTLQDNFDHRFAADPNDPILPQLKELHAIGAINLNIFEKGVGIERFAEFVFDVANKHISSISNGRCWVDQVEVFEHDKNSAIYSRKEVIGNWLADCSTGVGLDGRVVIGANVTEPTILCEDSVKPLDLAPGIKTATSPFIPTDQNAATVGKVSTPGLGGLFAGTRLG